MNPIDIIYASQVGSRLTGSVSSCGETQEKARANIQDAVRGFLEAAEGKGTLDEVLEEAGYQHVGTEWKAPEFVGVDRVNMRLCRSDDRHY